MFTVGRVSTTVAVMTLLGFGGLQLGAPAPQPLTEQQIATMPADRQAAYLGPLNAAFAALDRVGTTARADVYSGVVIDGPHHAVFLYLSDTTQAGDFLAAAQSVDPAANLGLVTVRLATYSKLALEAARARLVERRHFLSAPIVSIAVPPQGNALLVGLDQNAGGSVVGDAQQLALAETAGVPVRTSLVAPPQPTAGNRAHDLPRYSAGARIALGVNIGYCSSGIPAQRSGYGYLVTAAHCYRVGDSITHMNGYDPIGTVTDSDTSLDAEIIAVGVATSNVQPYEYDCLPGTCTRLLRLSGVGNSAVGQQVCQDGYTSGVVCGIVVDQTNVWNPLVGPQGPFSALGVWGHRIGGGCGSQPGDSGGLVFSINPDNTRQVRGIVSAAGGASCGVDKAGNSMFWTEATRIFSYFGLSLAS